MCAAFWDSVAKCLQTENQFMQYRTTMTNYPGIKQQFYTYINITQIHCKTLSRGVTVLFVCNTMFSLCQLLTLVCHVSNEQGELLAHVSSIAAESLLLPFWVIRLGQAWLGPLPPHTPFPGQFLVFLDPGNPPILCREQYIWVFSSTCFLFNIFCPHILQFSTRAFIQ